MKDKFTEYYSTPEKIAELSEYVHLNFRVIMTKMQSEMRRKLDIEPNMENRDGYYSLMLSLQGRLFNEMVYSLVSVLQSMNIKYNDAIPPATTGMLLDLMENKNPLEGRLRTDVVPNEKFNEYYLKEIEAIRAIREALPK